MRFWLSLVLFWLCAASMAFASEQPDSDTGNARESAKSVPAAAPSFRSGGETRESASSPDPEAEEEAEREDDAGRERAPVSFWDAVLQKTNERFRFSGLLEGMQSMRVKKPNDALTSRIRLHFETEADFSPLFGFVSANAEKNWKVGSETGLEVHELWFDYVGTGWDLRLGRQIIIWGRADGVQITDMISPPDYTEVMTRELDEIRLPVGAAKLRLMGKELIDRDLNLELILIPFFQKAILPEDDNPWALPGSSSSPVRVREAPRKKPSASLKNAEAAFKLSGYYSGLDVAVSAFHTWDDFAVYNRSVNMRGGIPELELEPEHHRMTVFGLEFARPWSDYVFRGEAAYYLGRYRDTKDIGTNPEKKDSVKWLLGIDWTPGDDWQISAQIINESIFQYKDYLTSDENAGLSTLNISKKLMNQTLTLANMIYCDLNRGEFYNRSKVDYEIRDGLHVSVGLDLFSSGAGQYGMYHDNTQVWCKLKYDF